jgi:acetyl-CoA C-acetyltransferase
MNAILDVNQGAALLLLSEHAARRHDVRPDRWVFPWAGIDVNELWFLQDRVDYHSLPGVRRAGEALLGRAGITIAQVTHLDFYSCFPIAPRLSAAMLGIAPTDPRPLTVTGGLPWFGGPGNNYTTHAIASLMEILRAGRESFALVHALGWIATKHALGVYSGTPPPAGWQRAGGPALQAWVDQLPHPPIAEEAHGRATIETYTVAHGRDGGPERGIVIGRLDDGRRFLAVAPRDRAVLEAMEHEEQVGRRGTVGRQGGLNVFEPDA